MFYSAHFEDHWMDSPTTQSPALTDPSYLVSTRFPSSDDRDISRPVLIAVHGFSATPYEWLELRDFAKETDDSPLISLILMGGHGRDLEALRKSKWTDWATPIINEFNALREQGYRNIHFLGASTGGTLLMDLVARGTFNALSQRHHFFMIDPFITPRPGLFKFIPFLSWLIRYYPGGGKRTELKRMNCYNHYPSRSLRELYKMFASLNAHLKNGFSATNSFSFHIYQSKGDTVVNPQGAQLLHDKLIGFGFNSTLEYVDSRHHVFLHGASVEDKGWSESDRVLQERVFQSILSGTSSK
jgi:carboxylesterase